MLDLRLLEDGGERGGALGSEAVVRDAVSEGQDQNRERVGVSTGADAKAITCGGCQQRARWCKQGAVRARLT